MPCSCHPDPETRPSGLSRRLVVAGGLAAGLAPFLPRVAGAETPGASFSGAGAAPDQTQEGTETVPPSSSQDFGFLPPRPASEKYVRPMMFPVLPDATLGKATWSDTYLAPRSDGRRHEGQDLMGKKMLKLLATVNGTIVELRHQSAGNSLYLEGDDGWYYCYLHINNDDPGTDNGANQFKYAFAPGMAVGKKVLQGDHMAYLGDSGNAESVGSHCHFEIRMPNAHWYNAAAVNAKYSLSAAKPAALRPVVGPAAFAPFTSAKAFATQQADDFLAGVPDAGWADRAAAELSGGLIGLDPFIERLLTEPRSAGYVAPVVRLYLGYFLRVPDYAGLTSWVNKVRFGTSLDVVSNQFAKSSEFTRRYGSLDNGAFVTQLYQNLFNRAPDADGLAYWKGKLDTGQARGWVMRKLCETDEYERKTRSQVRVISVYAAMARRSPDPSGFLHWVQNDAATPTGLQQLTRTLRTTASYQARVTA
jgi:murein DD-endopeptidase MepM/ murein hydrolase activator NlpD